MPGSARLARLLRRGGAAPARLPGRGPRPARPPRGRPPGARLAAASAPAARGPERAAVQADFATLHAFFESAHFGSAQARVASELAGALRPPVPPEPPELTPARGRELAGDPGPQEPRATDHVAAGAAPLPDPLDLLRRWGGDPEDSLLDRAQVLALLSRAEALLAQLRGPLLDVPLPSRGPGSPSGEGPKIVIVGDLHGQLLDLLHIMHAQGPPSEGCTYLINGDIADRGTQAVEIWLLVLAFKVRWPDRLHILRGNHENAALNERPREWGGGFSQECISKYGPEVYDLFSRLFLTLPLFAVVGGEVFVVHGGLFRTPGVTLERLRTLPCWQQPYPMDSADGREWTEDETILFDAQWADPHPTTGIKDSRRGSLVRSFGKDVTAQFLEANGLSLCIRSHEVPKSGRGFQYTHAKGLLTVFSASNYADMLGNDVVADSLRSSSPHLWQARQSAEVAARLNRVIKAKCCEEDREDAVTQLALGIVLYHRDALRAHCAAADGFGTGRVPRTVLLDGLRHLSVEDFDWDALLKRVVGPGSSVGYETFLKAIRIKWLYLPASQANVLASELLRGEVPLQDLSDLFACRLDGVERCGRESFRDALHRLAPCLSDEQVSDLLPLFGPGAPSPAQLVERLLLLGPPFRPPEPWMQEALCDLRERILERYGRSGGHGRPHDVLVAFFSEVDDGGGAGVLQVPALARALEGLLPAKPAGAPPAAAPEGGAGAGADGGGLQALATAMDFSGSGNVSFLEFARAFLPAPGAACAASGAAEERLVAAACEGGLRGYGDSCCVDLLFMYRGLVVQGCRLLDREFSSQVPAEVFVHVAGVVGEAVGRPLSGASVERLRAALGGRNIPYSCAMKLFHVALEANHASPLA